VSDCTWQTVYACFFLRVFSFVLTPRHALQNSLVLILGDNPFQVDNGVLSVPDFMSISSLAILDLHNLDPFLLAGES